MTDNRSFAALGLSPETLAILKQKGFQEPTPIQERVIPLLLQQQRDIIGQAQTGTGKTAAFGLPILERISTSPAPVQALILTPTRELALQIAAELESLKGRPDIRILPVYGGQAIGGQLKALKRGVDIVIGTPGRVIDHLGRKTLDLSRLSWLVLDEADEMLNMGFIEDVEAILEAAGPERRTLLFSATLPGRIRDLGARYLGAYELVVAEPDRLVTGLTEQICFEVREADKLEALSRIIDIEESFYGLVFCRTRVMVARLAEQLAERGIAAEALHGDISQDQRETILDRFRRRRTSVLVATDVAARGIDIVNLSHVINFSLPDGPESYVHRIGRTGRAGNRGVAVTFITPGEYGRLTYIERAARVVIHRRRLPGIDDVLRAKAGGIRAEIEAVAARGCGENYRSLADDLLANREPREILAAALSFALGGRLERRNYREIHEPMADRKGKARLFIPLGRRDGLSRLKLVRLIEARSGVREYMLQGAEVYDVHSFITVPFHAAETILQAFRRGGQGPKLGVRIAAPVRPAPRRMGAARGKDRGAPAQGRSPSRSRM